MAKLSHGAARGGAGKKKSKRRPEARPTAPMPTPDSNERPARRQEVAGGGAQTATIVQFKPRARDGAVSRAMSGRPSSAAKALQQAVDYSYVYTDLKIIGGITLVLVGGLIGLSFVIH